MATAPTWTLPSDAAIKAILVERTDEQRDGVGIVVGVVDHTGNRVVAHGRFKRGGRRLVDRDTVFEIGSITKVFTSLLLSDMALRGEVALDDPVAKHLPDGVTVPERGGRRITLADLATHTSGLPRSPTNLAPKDPSNPYDDYTVEQLYAFLSGYALTRDIGVEYEYSNLGAGLLGHVLARRRSTDYESLAKELIAGPLGLDDTSIQLSGEQRKRLSHGHDAEGRPTSNWDLREAAAGCGALRSTTDDLLAFLSVALGYEGAPLKSAIDAQLAYPTRPTPQEGLSVGLGWHVIDNEHGQVVWHNGGTGGYRTFMGLNRARGWGVIVLTNAATSRGGDDIGMHILTGGALAPAPKRRLAITVDASALEGLVGRYVLSAEVWVTVTRKGNRLFGQLTGLEGAEIFAESPTHFFSKVVNAQVTFKLGPDGRAVSLVLHQSGRDLPAERCAETPSAE
jgi:serine-type D-Ala-D-Ala carboxypeptidase/endopeptidase